VAEQQLDLVPNNAPQVREEHCIGLLAPTSHSSPLTVSRTVGSAAKSVPESLSQSGERLHGVRIDKTQSEYNESG